MITTRIVTDSNGRKHITNEPLLHPPQQEPVAWTSWRELAGARHYRTPGWEMYADKRNPDDVALYTSPPAQRTWVGLTDDDELDWEEGGSLKDLVKAIEAKLKEKNT